MKEYVGDDSESYSRESELNREFVFVFEQQQSFETMTTMMKSLDERKSIEDVLTAATYSESIRSDEVERSAGDDDDDESDDEND